MEARQYYYFYKSLNDTLAQERAQLAQLEDIVSPPLFKFGVATRFGSAMGHAWPLKPVHLIELTLFIEKLDYIDSIVVRDESGDPHPTHEHGMALILPSLKELARLMGVSSFRAYDGDTISKWLSKPEEKQRQDKGSILAQLLTAGDTDATSPDG